MSPPSVRSDEPVLLQCGMPRARRYGFSYTEAANSPLFWSSLRSFSPSGFRDEAALFRLVVIDLRIPTGFFLFLKLSRRKMFFTPFYASVLLSPPLLVHDEPLSPSTRGILGSGHARIVK